MNLATRTILMLTLATAPMAVAQEAETTTAPAETSTATSTAATSTATTTTDDATTTATTSTAPAEEVPETSQQLRRRFSDLLREHPHELPSVLALDPTLLSNETYLTGYPKLARFLAANPEVQRNPRFYLAEFTETVPERSLIQEIIEPLSIMFVFGIVAFALSWVLRTLIEQKRWTRLSRTQTEVHNKILDRFSTSSELLEYIKTPAGSKFLESAPIPLQAAEQVSTPRNPLTRVIWSIQAGVIVAAGAIGMLLVSLRLEKESSQELFALGAIALFIGLGFIASSVVSIVLSRRLGLWQPDAATNDRLDDARLVK